MAWLRYRVPEGRVGEVVRRGLAQEGKELFQRIAGLFDDAMQGSSLQFSRVHGHEGPPAIRVTSHDRTACVMVDHEAGTTEDVEEFLGGERWQSHRAGTVMGTVSGLMISVGPSSGMGSPCLSKLAP